MELCSGIIEIVTDATNLLAIITGVVFLWLFLMERGKRKMAIPGNMWIYDDGGALIKGGVM